MSFFRDRKTSDAIVTHPTGRSQRRFVSLDATEARFHDVAHKHHSYSIKFEPALSLVQKSIAQIESRPDYGGDCSYQKNGLSTSAALRAPCRTASGCHQRHGARRAVDRRAAGIRGRLAAACYGYYILPTYPSDLATIQFDRSGTTRIGKYVINHSFILPGLIGVFSSCVFGYIMATVRGLV